jgi:hypothetical protein
MERMMKENISVEGGKCCTHRLNQTFRSVAGTENLNILALG